MPASKSHRVRSRQPGRPAGRNDDDVRSALLEAAGKLFLKHGFAQVTARQIAAAAGTTPAMIHYYYENKDGLFQKMLQDAIAPLAGLLSGALQSSASAPDLRALIAAHLRLVSANPWIATLIVNEVLPEGGHLRAIFIRDIAGRMLPMMTELLERERVAGRLRTDLDPKLATLSLLSLNMFPFITRVVLGPVLGLKLEGPELDALIEHNTNLFYDGIASRTARTHS